MDLFDIWAYDYELPKELIAQTPANPQDSCRLFFYDWMKGKDLIFSDIDKLIDKDTIIFFNNTKVIKSRIAFNDAKFSLNWKEKQSSWEIFFLNFQDKNTFEALVKPWKKFKIWTKILIDWAEFEVLDITKDWRLIKTNIDNLYEFMEENWQMPLPPYIQYSKDKEDWYQAIFAEKLGSTAAPTASLHFTDNVLNKLKDKWVWFEYCTLHIGLWTFKSVDTQDIREYNIHWEQIILWNNIFDKIAEYKLNNKKILWVWTTITRTLESLPYLWEYLKKEWIKITKNEKTIKYWNDLTNWIENKEFIINPLVIWNQIQFETKLFIYPWFKYEILDELITNFHLPKSSLLMLVAAFIGYDNLMSIYSHCIKQWYRFFSFWDTMYLKP